MKLITAEKLQLPEHIGTAIEQAFEVKKHMPSVAINAPIVLSVVFTGILISNELRMIRKTMRAKS